jgi:hypothetical protein
VRLILAIVSIGVLVLAAGCGAHGSPSGSRKLETISSVDRFGGAFNEGSGHPRLVLLLSPT